MRVLVTGATGLIGSAVCDALLARGEEVVGLSRDPAKARSTNPTVSWHAWDPANERLADYTEDRLAALIGSAAGTAGLPVRIERVGSFSFAALVADRFREGDVFLAGDAAHRVTPRGGTGMNMAMQGAFALGWRLAWVLRGWAGPELLDGYERERRPIVEHNIERSTDPEGSRRDPGEELQMDLAGRIQHLWTA